MRSLSDLARHLQPYVHYLQDSFSRLIKLADILPNKNNTLTWMHCGSKAKGTYDF